MAYWILKSEPAAWSWERMAEARVTEWDGVRNPEALNHLAAMRVGDRAFFYHSGSERRIVGIVEIVRPYYPDPADETGRFGMVDVKAVASLPRPVPLHAIKAEPRLRHLALVRRARLSVSTLDGKAWRRLCKMGGT